MTALEDAAGLPRNQQHIYAWAMNNYWHCNYRAYQEGVARFRFVLRPHRGLDLVESARFGQGCSQPLVATPATGAPPSAVGRLSVSRDDVLVTGFKPAEDGNGWIVRLLNASREDRQVTLAWGGATPVSLWLSGTGEERRERLQGRIEVPACGLITLRADER
jgi:alpha-mannosidase